MIFSVSPVKSLSGEVFLPASKSYSIRAFFIAACGGRSKITAPSNCEDAIVARRVAKKLGARIHAASSNIWRVDAQQVRPARCVSVGESGTALRFVLPLLALHGKNFFVLGKGTLRGRPNHSLLALLRKKGADVYGSGVNESIPIRGRGGKFQGGFMAIEGDVSSQFISALLIACPQLDDDTDLIIRGRELVSQDYVEMTLQVLRQSGIRIIRKGIREFQIPGRQKFRGLGEFIVPSDAGLTAFLLAAGCLVPSHLLLRGSLPKNMVQADARIFDILKKMGVCFKKTEKKIELRGPFSLKGGDFDLQSAPDLVPVLSVLALFARGRTRLYNIRHARVKESDRLSDLRHELLKIGAKIKERAGELLIDPQPQYKKGVLLNPHRDHRLAMAFAVLGVKVGVKIQDMECVRKSYPDFCQDFRKIRRGG